MKFSPLMGAILLASPMLASGGPLAYGICQTGCNTVVVACYAAAGYTFGTVTAGAGVPAWLLHGSLCCRWLCSHSVTNTAIVSNTK